MYGENAQGRPVGYGVSPVFCDVFGCLEVIDRGLSYCCGGMHDGGDFGCGGYFCSQHTASLTPDGELCGPCSEWYWETHCSECGEEKFADDEFCNTCTDTDDDDGD
jgi:hypothetical protein